MNELLNTLAIIFTGKGGTLRLAITGSLGAALIYEILESGYGFSANSSNGTFVSLTPPAERAAAEQQSSDAVAGNTTPSENEETN